jgi:putative oxidoreductase
MSDNVGSRFGQDNLGKLIVRLAVAGLLLLHGIAKLKHGVGWMSGPLAAAGLPAFLAYGSFLGEIIAPLLAIVGKWTRLAGLVIAGDLAFAIMLVRRGDVLTIGQGGGWAIELEMLFLLGGIALFFLGSGRYSISRGAGTFD